MGWEITVDKEDQPKFRKDSKQGSDAQGTEQERPKCCIPMTYRLLLCATETQKIS